VLRILVLALAFAQATGISDYLEATCGDDCAEQDCDGGACPPICPSCHCAMRPPATAAASSGMLPLRVSTPIELVSTIDEVPASPDPHEILRVPIARPV